jgi:hypothetical protein
MIKKQSNFIEEHIEKVALVIGVLAAIFVIYKFVLQGPTLPYDNQTFRPGQLDIYVAEQAEKLKERLEREPIPKPAYVPQSISFLAKMDSVIDNNLVSVLWPMPSSVESVVNKKYRIPVIGDVNSIDVEHIRAAAYIPKVAVTPDNVDTEGTYEVNDLDLVTVQGSFDLVPLLDSFQECFAGKGVPEGWRDAALAKPVFAGVQLQRQSLGDDGQWSEWQDVPRVKTDPQGDKYKIIDNLSELPNGGVMVELAKFGEPRTQASLLQPDSYNIASAEERWMPPVLHRKYLAMSREKEAQDRREAIVAERETKTTEARPTRPVREERPAPERTRGGGATTGRATPGGGAGRSPVGGRGAGAGGGGRSPIEMERGGAARDASRGTTRPGTEQPRDRRTDTTATDTKKTTVKPVVTEASIDAEMRKMLLARKDVSILREPIAFWAYDDTTEPGASYRYRIRLGVFNPLAGTDQVREEDAASKNKVILWSGYSEVTDIIDIPKRLYFFPVNVQETAKAAEVQVCKYVLGYWHSEQFMVKRGDMIGKVAKVDASEKDKISRVKLPEAIDYTTGAIIVDMVAENDWVGDKALQPRQYFDVLFSVDGVNVDRLPAKQMYWPEDLRLKYSELKALEKKPKEPFRARGESGTIEIQQRPGMPGDRRGPMDRGGEQTQQDEYMRMRMGERGPPQ